MKFAIAGTLLLTSLSCTGPRFLVGLKPVDEKSELVVLTRYSTSSYYKNESGDPSGFEFELVSAFAKDMGWNVKFELEDSTKDVLEELEIGRGHMAAASLTITPDRKERFEFSKPYYKIQQELVCGEPQSVKSPVDLEKLSILVVEGTSYEETIRALQGKNPEIAYRTHDETSEETLEMIWENRDLCTVIDSHLLSVHRRYFPELRVVYELTKKDRLAWAFSEVDDDLKSKADRWLAGKGKNKIKELKTKYYGHVKEFDYYDTKKFIERIGTRLPKFRELFEKAAQKTGLDWKFLAAVAYQESQWDPGAVSPTGVRGLMMLTQATAKELGVTDRRDPAQSIDGGARYIIKQQRRLPAYIRSDDRRWFAMASYNVGYYHLRDAMALAVLENKSPGVWSQVREILPLLSKKKYYKNLRYGYARGLEPVIYVSRIRNYYDLLKTQL